MVVKFLIVVAEVVRGVDVSGDYVELENPG